ncbi:TetR/AcrR family transcriptional regulator [Streptacidiphilus cavernicola]|uniref:TetR/AcrR family transcriptional regulator n=1 Tax=Streptacidiphilus cavernicola TaxID=3342716 RepID=A0ABV6W578_9ACTN
MAREEQRGSTPKGVAKRAEILRAALRLYGEADQQQAPSLKQIADAVGLTEAGVLHYFDSKDDMLLSVLAMRDEVARELFDMDTWEGSYRALKQTYETPGEVKLYVDMLVASANTGHPAHAFMNARNDRLQARLRSLLGEAGADGWLPRTLVATLEGLQLQWLRDPSLDVVEDMRRLHEVLVLPALQQQHSTGRPADQDAE